MLNTCWNEKRGPYEKINIPIFTETLNRECGTCHQWAVGKMLSCLRGKKEKGLSRFKNKKIRAVSTGKQETLPQRHGLITKGEGGSNTRRKGAK